ncbi:MAG: ribonuclease III domain-containing protein [Methanomethylophilus sp.]|jgi:23S rRNA maturation mini-RNase III
MAEDAFAEALENREKLPWVKRGLTDRSYKKKINHNVSGDSDNNFELATVGDALLKFSLSMILLDRVDQLTKKREVYECDKNLVKIIGKHYHIADYILYDSDNKDILMDYRWDVEEGEDPPHKHIATAVEGALGGLYMEHKDLDEIFAIVRKWIDLVDTENKVSEAVRHPGY